MTLSKCYLLRIVFLFYFVGQCRALGASPPPRNQVLKPLASGLSRARFISPPGTTGGLDTKSRRQNELSHLNSVIRYYQSTLAPIQRAGSLIDAQYRNEATLDGIRVVQIALQSGRAEVNLEAVFEAGSPDPDGIGSEEQKVRDARAPIMAHIVKLTVERKSLQEEVTRARSDERQTLHQKLDQVDSEIDLDTAMNEALGKILDSSRLLGNTGLAGDIARLQRTTPELMDGKPTPAPSPMDSLSGITSAGLSSQIAILLQFRGTRQAIDDLVNQTEALEQQAVDLQSPLTAIVGQMTKFDSFALQKGDTPGGGFQGDPLMSKDAFDAKSTTLRALSATAIPLTQEIIELEQSRANLLAWRQAVSTEGRGVLRSLVLRFSGIAVTLLLLLVLGEVWKRLTLRWVHDEARKRQLMGPRRIVIGCLCALVVLFGSVTQFHSLATFAGFIVAGLAVGLQTILLSVAAYGFIIGRYGVRVGDRMTISGITGNVIEVDLLRFYLIELAGSGDELQLTGRVAVFNNAVLFQAGTPLFKQMPGVAYTWHEMTLPMQLTSSHELASKTILAAVNTIYEQYHDDIERQHTGVMAWADIKAGMPKVESKLQFAEGGLQLLIRFPVQLDNASTIDEEITQMMVSLMLNSEEVNKALTAQPTIRAVIR